MIVWNGWRKSVFGTIVSQGSAKEIRLAFWIRITGIFPGIVSGT